MQAELEKVSSLLDAATKSFATDVNEDGCVHLSQAAAILDQIIAESEEAALMEELHLHAVAA
jgi:hypothetical protein